MRYDGTETPVDRLNVGMELVKGVAEMVKEGMEGGGEVVEVGFEAGGPEVGGIAEAVVEESDAIGSKGEASPGGGPEDAGMVPLQGVFVGPSGDGGEGDLGIGVGIEDVILGDDAVDHCGKKM